MHKSILLLLTGLLCSFQIAVITTTDLQVMKAAEGQMGVFLARIPPGSATDYGFKQEDDMELCTIGKPYRFIEFNQDFYEDSTPIEDRNYVTIKNEWLAPISIKDVNRTLLSVKGNPGNYHVTAMGDTDLAKELQIKSRGVSDSDEYYLLTIPALSATFFVHEATSSFLDAEFTPLASARKEIPSLSKSYTGAFTLMEVQQKVKDELYRRFHKDPIRKPKKKPVQKKTKIIVTDKTNTDKAK
jgi:hypothetical protein